MIELRYFKPEEFNMDSKVVYVHMQEDFLKALDDFRHEFGHPIRITSSYRDTEYNEKIGGAPNSMHCKGRAVDMYIGNYTGSQRRKLIRLLDKMDLTYGMAKTFVHVDNRDNATAFGYGNK